MADKNCLSVTIIGCVVAVAFPVVMFGGCLASVFMSNNEGASTKTVANVSTRIGDVVYLYNGEESSPVTIFPSEKIASDFLGAVGRKDKEGALDIWLRGGMFDVPAKTRVRVLGYGGFLFGLTHVRVLEGDHYPKDGWVPGEWIKK